MKQRALYVAGTKPDSSGVIACNSCLTLVYFRGCVYSYTSLDSAPTLRGKAGAHRNCAPVPGSPPKIIPATIAVSAYTQQGTPKPPCCASIVFIRTSTRRPLRGSAGKLVPNGTGARTCGMRASRYTIRNWERAVLAPSTRPGYECALITGRYLPRIVVCDNQQIGNIAPVILAKRFDNFRIIGVHLASVPSGNGRATYSSLPRHFAQGDTPFFMRLFLGVQISNPIPHWHKPPPFDRSYLNRISNYINLVNIDSSL
jgi:hypothetical protein